MPPLFGLEDFPPFAIFATFWAISETFTARTYIYMSDKKDGQKTALLSIVHMHNGHIAHIRRSRATLERM